MLFDELTENNIYSISVYLTTLLARILLYLHYFFLYYFKFMRKIYKREKGRGR